MRPPRAAEADEPTEALLPPGNTPAARRFHRRAGSARVSKGAGNRSLQRTFTNATTELIRRLTNMGRGLVLWLVGIPLPVILILYFLGYLH